MLLPSLRSTCPIHPHLRIFIFTDSGSVLVRLYSLPAVRDFVWPENSEYLSHALPVESIQFVPVWGCDSPHLCPHTVRRALHWCWKCASWFSSCTLKISIGAVACQKHSLRGPVFVWCLPHCRLVCQALLRGVWMLQRHPLHCHRQWWGHSSCSSGAWSWFCWGWCWVLLL